MAEMKKLSRMKERDRVTIVPLNVNPWNDWFARMGRVDHYFMLFETKDKRKLWDSFRVMAYILDDIKEHYVLAGSDCVIPEDYFLRFRDLYERIMNIEPTVIDKDNNVVYLASEYRTCFLGEDVLVFSIRLQKWHRMIHSISKEYSNLTAQIRAVLRREGKDKFYKPREEGGRRDISELIERDII